MKKVLAASLLLVAGMAYADTASELTRCEKILVAGFYHEAVEAVCDFDNQTSDALQAAYTDNHCAALMSAEAANQIIVATLKDARERYAAQGKTAFCSTANRNAYSTLTDFLIED
ncbi:MAG: hypothetical protein Q4G42_06775 [Neisseria sp.]|nr:hypothetical protein [Neisseria sp.]